MGNKKTLIKKELSKQNAQALVEVAIIGTILLFCMLILVREGMQANFQQSLLMRTYRDAISEAYHNRANEKTYSALIIEDKHIPDPQNPFGIGQIRPFHVNTSAAFTRDLFAHTSPENLPRTKMIIDGQLVHIGPGTNIEATGTNLPGLNTPDPHPERGLRTAGFRSLIYGPETQGVEQTFFVKTNDYPEDLTMPNSDKCRLINAETREYDCEHGGDGIYWKWDKVTWRPAYLVDDEDEIIPSIHRGYVVPDMVFDDNRLYLQFFDPPEPEEKIITRGSMADVDNDGEEEMIISIKGAAALLCPPNGSSCGGTIYAVLPGDYWGNVNKIYYFDYQEGDIDTTITDVDEKQGLQRDYNTAQQTQGSGNILRRQESEEGIMVEEKLNTQFDITRKVLLNEEGTTCSGDNCYLDISSQRLFDSDNTTTVYHPLE